MLPRRAPARPSHHRRSCAPASPNPNLAAYKILDAASANPSHPVRPNRLRRCHNRENRGGQKESRKRRSLEDKEEERKRRDTPPPPHRGGKNPEERRPNRGSDAAEEHHQPCALNDYPDEPAQHGTASTHLRRLTTAPSPSSTSPPVSHRRTTLLHLCSAIQPPRAPMSQPIPGP